MSKLGQQLNRVEGIILRPHLTEKASLDQRVEGAASVYVFQVAPRATKLEVKRAVQLLYKVKPTKINLVQVKGKRLVYRGHRGQAAGYKKALVYVPAGEKITLI